jgi:hypothetical protein
MIVYIIVIMNRALTESTRMAQQGRITEGITALQAQRERDGDSYSILSNLAALHLQLGHL